MRLRRAWEPAGRSLTRFVEAPGRASAGRWGTRRAGAVRVTPGGVRLIPARRDADVPGVVAISLCMIVRNEESSLPRCLKSAAAAVDEAVVVDTGSTDDTVAVARNHGATVLRYRNAPGEPLHLGRARNAGLDQAGGDVALVLDADETLDPVAVAAVRAWAASSPDVGHVVTRRNLRAGRPVPDWTDHAVRLFPLRPEHRYRHRVHETVDEAILGAGSRLVVSDIVVDHHLAAGDVLRAKWAWYVDLLREDLAAAPDDLDRLHYLRADLYKLQRYEEAIEVAERIAALSPDDFDARFQAALLTHAHGHDEAAAGAHLAAALGLRPGDADALALSRRRAARDTPCASPRPPSAGSS